MADLAPHAEPAARHGADLAIGFVGMSSVFGWVEWLHAGDDFAGFIAAWGGAALVIGRLGLMVREYRRGRR